MSDVKMRVKYFEEVKLFDFIEDYKAFINKCHQEFEMSDEEKESLKIVIINDGDNMDIENEQDFKDNLDAIENNELVCILTSSGKKKKPEPSKVNFSCDNNNMDSLENPQLSKVSTAESKIMNSEILNKLNDIKIPEIDYSKITQSHQLENEKCKSQILEEVKKIYQVLEKEIKNKIKTSINDIKAFLMGVGNDLSGNTTELNKLKNIITNNISDIQSNNEKINEQLLETIKREIKENINASVNKTNELENQIKRLNEIIKELKELIQNQNKIIQSLNKKEEKKHFFGAQFLDGNFIFSYYYEDLMKMKELKLKIKLLNSGTLPWPKQLFIYGVNEQKTLGVKQCINPYDEILPNQLITIPISINLNKIKNENCEFNLSLKLIYINSNIPIKQNQLQLQLNVKMSKQENDIFENFSKTLNPPPKNMERFPNKIMNEGFNKKDDNNFNNKGGNNNKFGQGLMEDNEDSEDVSKKTVSKKLNKNQNLIEKYFQKIKDKLEEDYNFSNEGWDDEKLKSKIEENLNQDIIKLIEQDEIEGIRSIAEKIGEDLLI